MAEDIYYDNLENYNEDLGNVLELKAEKELLEERIKEMTNTMKLMNKALSKPSVLVEGLRIWMLSCQEEHDELKQKYNDMSTNFSSLIMTVKAELSRKDRIIADLNREKDEIIFNKHRSNTCYPPKSPPQNLQIRKRRNSSLENDMTKKPRSILMVQRDNNSSRTSTQHREISKHTEGMTGDYSENSRVRRADLNTNTTVEGCESRRSDKNQEKTSTKSRIKSTPEKQYSKFNMESYKKKNRSQSTDRNTCRTLKHTYEDNSNSTSKRIHHRNESLHNKYNKKSSSGEIDYRARVLRSPSNEHRSRNYKSSHRTYGRLKSFSYRTPSREKESTHSRDSRNKHYKDMDGTNPKGKYQQDYYEKEEKPNKPFDGDIHFSSSSECSQARTAIPLKCEKNSPIQILASDPVTFVENDPRSKQYRNMKEETDLKMIPLYKDDSINAAIDVKHEWCAESPNFKEWIYENVFVSELPNINKNGEREDEEKKVKKEQQELNPSIKVLKSQTTNETNEVSLEPSKSNKTKEHKKERRHLSNESTRKNSSEAQKEKKSSRKEKTHKKDKSKKTKKDKNKMEFDTPPPIKLKSESPTLSSSGSSDIMNVGCVDNMNFIEVTKTEIKSDLVPSDSTKVPDVNESNIIHISNVLKEPDPSIDVQKKVSQNIDVNGVISKNDTQHEQENTQTSEESITKPNTKLMLLSQSITNTNQTNIIETSHQTDLVNKNTNTSEDYNKGSLIATSRDMKQNIVLKTEEKVNTFAICQENKDISLSKIVEVNYAKENDVTIGNQNEYSKISSESKDSNKQNKLMIRRRKTVVKRKE